MHLAALLLNCLAFILLEAAPLWANVLFVSVLAGGVLLMIWMDRRVRWA
jgi:hypothetical protein